MSVWMVELLNGKTYHVETDTDLMQVILATSAVHHEGLAGSTKDGWAFRLDQIVAVMRDGEA